jgi:hypothetical protein
MYFHNHPLRSVTKATYLNFENRTVCIMGNNNELRAFHSSGVYGAHNVDRTVKEEQACIKTLKRTRVPCVPSGKVFFHFQGRVILEIGN